jgi:hypothetical protein
VLSNLAFLSNCQDFENKLSSKSKQFSVYDEAVQSHNSKKVSGIEKHGLKTDPRVLIL